MPNITRPPEKTYIDNINPQAFEAERAAAQRRLKAARALGDYEWRPGDNGYFIHRMCEGVAA